MGWGRESVAGGGEAALVGLGVWVGRVDYGV